MTTPTIPTWEWTQLEDLSAQGDLSGVNPIVIGSIDQAESSGNGGGINPSGYGGFFGLSASGDYPESAGGEPTAQLLEGTSTQSFDSQAEIAAAAFNEYLNEADGNPIDAEEIYQTGAADGPTEGSNILAANLGSSSAGGSAGNPTPATTTALNANPFDLFGIPQSAATAVWSDVGPFLVKAILVITGLAIVVLGVYRLASPKISQAVQAAGPAIEAAAA